MLRSETAATSTELTVNSSILGVLVTSLSVPAAQDGPTIPQQLLVANRPLVHMYTVPSGAPPALRDVLADADIVVKGTVGERHSYLSEDEREVLTDYDIVGPLVVQSLERSTEATVALEGLIVTLPGGSVTINGLTYTSIHQALRELERGAMYMLLLKKSGSKYQLARIYLGAFQIRADGRLRPLARGFAPELNDLPENTAAAALRAIAKDLRSR